MLAKLRLRAMQALPPRLVGEFRGWQLRRRLRALEAGVLGGAAPLPVLPAEAVASFEVHVAEIVARLRSQGVEPVLLTYPTLVHEDNRAALEDVLSGERTFRIWLSDEALLDAARQLNDATRRVAMRTETSLVDVDASLGRTVEEFADQVHYTDRGARRVAEIVRDALEGLGMPFPQGGGPASRAAP
jgi:hypothetical protein